MSAYTCMCAHVRVCACARERLEFLLNNVDLMRLVIVIVKRSDGSL